MTAEKGFRGKILEYLALVLGSFFAVAGINLLLAPHVIAPGGVAGLTIVVERVFGIPMFLTYLLVNIPLMVITLRLFGKESVFKTFVAMLAYSLALKFEAPKAITDDLLLASVLGGFMNGLGTGVVIKFGGTTGGTDLIGAIANKLNPSLKLSNVMFSIDLFVVALAAIVEKRIEIGIYSAIAAYMTSTGIDYILEGLERSKSFHIITDRPEDIRNIILNEVKSGGTVIKGQGMYSGEEKYILLCVVDRREFPRLRELVSDVDPNVFMLITETKEVYGGAFKRYKN